jgi:hypothetical protein
MPIRFVRQVSTPDLSLSTGVRYIPVFVRIRRSIKKV